MRLLPSSLGAAAYNSADVDKVAASYTPDAVFWGTTMENLATTPEGIRAYFAELPKHSPRSSVRILDLLQCNYRTMPCCLLACTNFPGATKPAHRHGLLS
jgi:hypothetical protein